MAGQNKTILVYDGCSADAPILLGKLYVGVIKGGESYSFEYDKEWLAKNKLSINLEPELAPKFGITEAKAKELAEEIKQVVMNNWERMAKENGLSRGEIENMRPAFII